MAAQTVHFMNGADKSWAQSLLTKLFKGQSKFSVLPFATTKQSSGANEGGIQWADLSFEGADEIFTLKDSFTMSKADDTEDNIQIDQNSGATIDTSISERGEWTFEGNIPVIAAEYCSIFYDAGATIASANPIVGQQGTTYQGAAYGMESKQVEATIMIENDAVTRALAFARVNLRISPVFESGSPAYLRLNGTILANTDKGGTQGDWAVVEKVS